MIRAKTKTAKYFLRLSVFAALVGFCSSSSFLKNAKTENEVAKCNNRSVELLENDIVISVVQAEINTIYNGYASLEKEIHYVYQLPSIRSYSNDEALITAQVKTKVENQQDIRFVVRQAKGTLAWNLPSKVGQSMYFEATRTLCLDGLENNMHPSIDSSSSGEIITVAVSSFNHVNSSFSLQVAMIEDFQIGSGGHHSLIQGVSFSDPAVRYIASDDSTDKVLHQIRINSEDDVCSLVSIQEFSCPFYDTIESIRSKGNYQTMLQSATFNYDWALKKYSDNDGGGAYIILMVLDDDSMCGGNGMQNLNRYKNFTISIINHVSRKDIGIGIGISLGFMGLVTIVVIILSIFRRQREKRQDPEKLMETLRSSYTKTELRNETRGKQGVDNIVLTGYRALGDSEFDMDTREMQELNEISAQNKDKIGNDTTTRSINTDITMKEIDRMIQKSSAKQVEMPDSVPKYLIDLATKSSKATKNDVKKTTMFQKTSLYVYIVMMMALFYGIPAIQLVINYQEAMSDDGNQDICYFNFLCSIPVGVVKDFNHIFSNVFYIWFGVLFIFLVASKEWKTDT